MNETFPTKSFSVKHPQFVGSILASIGDPRTSCNLIVVGEDGEPTDNYLDGADICSPNGAKIGKILNKTCTIHCAYDRVPSFKVVKDGLECEVTEIPDTNEYESDRLVRQFLDSIPQERKTRLVKRAEEISASAAVMWNVSGHTVQWDQPYIETGRNINYPKDESLYARRNAHCTQCGFDMWLLVHDDHTVLKGGAHQCTRSENRK
jgi:hypothetical protein